MDLLEPRVLLSVTPNDPEFPSQYALTKIDAPDAWATTTGNSTEVVAVLDTGIDLNSTDLAANIWTNPNPNDNAKFPDDLHGWNFVNNNNDVQDNFVHGTSTAAVIGAVGNNGIGITGIGWNVKILPVEIGTIAGADAATVTAGINYIIGLKKEGVNIVAINASYISYTAPSSAEISAINNAGSAGMLYVAAAGNDSLNLNSIYPASFIPSNMIMVAATDENDALWDQSNYGSSTVAVGAPGVDIETLIPGNINISLSGTSYAAPMVTGIAVLLKAADPSATVAQLKTAILDGGDLDPALAGKTITGRRVNAEGSLNYLLNHVTPVPTNHPPTGALQSTATVISGYAQDPDAPTKSISVQLDLDGKKWKTVTASVNRPDLTATLGSPKHGFSVPLSSLPAGVHRLDVYALDTLTHLPTLLGTAEVTNNLAPIGAVNVLTATSLIGYAYDADEGSKPIEVRYTIDGGAPIIVSANLKRPDLTATLGSASHGFAIALPALTAGDHLITVDAIDPRSDQLVQLTSQTLTIAAVAGDTLPTGTLSTLTNTQVAGTVTDSAAATPLKIRIDIDGKKGKLLPTTVTADPTTDTFASTLKLTKGAHRIDVYVIDPLTNVAVLLERQLVGYTPATGAVTSLLSTGVAGTALSPNGKSGKSLIRIDIDGLTGNLLTVAPTFRIALPPLSTGNHTIEVTLIDPTTLQPTLLTDQTLAFA
jgi:hypothetical protein